MKCSTCGFSANPDSAVNCKLCGKPLERSDEALPPGRRKRKPPPRVPLCHLLIRPGSKPVELTVGTVLTLGRESECDLPIPSPRVSRQHAVIGWKDERPVLKDLGSENGTLVDGKPIQGEHRLRDREQVEIGPYTCTYRCLRGEGGVTRLLKVMDDSAKAQPLAEETFAGRLDERTLTEVLYSLEMHGRTGVLEVFDTEAEDGKVVVREGRPVFAVSGDQIGEIAVRVLLRRDQGQFRFEPDGADAVTPNMEEGQTITALLLEASQREGDRMTMRRGFGGLGDLDVFSDEGTIE